MKYYVVSDGRGYILSVNHTGTFKDYVELDLSQYDLTKIRAYKLGKDELIFDEEEWARIEANRQQIADKKEIASLKAFLAETANYPMRAWEEIMALTNPITWVADVIKITVKYSKEYRTILEQRVAAWKRLDELDGGGE